MIDSNNKPICVLEAKKEDLHPLVAKNKQENMRKPWMLSLSFCQMELFTIYGI